MTEPDQPGPAQIQADMGERILAAIAAITDPVDRIESVNQTIYNLSGLTGQLAAITRDAVREMHKTQSYAEIGKALGVTRARAQQLANRPPATAPAADDDAP
jgi:hypothetical protein